MSARLGTALLVGAVLCCQAAQDTTLAQIAELPDVERRSRQALEFAHDRLDTALQAYAQGALDVGRRELGAVGDAVELAVESLESTGKHPRRHPRHFKHAEIRTRKLLQQLRQAQRQGHVEDSADFEGPIRRVEQANQQLLLGIMSPKK